MKKTTNLSLKSISLIIALGLPCAPLYAADTTAQTTATVTIVIDGETYSEEVDFSDPVSVKNAIDAMVSSRAGNLDGVTSVFIQHATDLSGANQTTFIPATVSDGQIIPLVIDTNDTEQIAQVSNTISDMGGSSGTFQNQASSAPAQTGTSDSGTSDSDSSDSGTSDSDSSGSDSSGSDSSGSDPSGSDPSGSASSDSGSSDSGSSTPSSNDSGSNEQQIIGDGIDTDGEITPILALNKYISATNNKG